MSLDVYLDIKGAEVQRCGGGIFIRENGKNKEISREEWDEKFPGVEPFVVTQWEGDCVYSANITHNLTKMAREAGIYEYLWSPEEVSVKKAKDLITPLRKGISSLSNNPDHFKQFNPSNGWGDYEGFVSFVVEYFCACAKYPEAEVSISK